jgi:hypothetical protein
MKLHTKVIIATQQRPTIARASASMLGTCPNEVLLKFVTSKDHQVALRRCKGLTGTKLGLDEDLMLAQQPRKSEMWTLFKEAKAMGKCAFWRTAEFFINII